jgi:hypothetical protein
MLVECNSNGTSGVFLVPFSTGTVVSIANTMTNTTITSTTTQVNIASTANQQYKVMMFG